MFNKKSKEVLTLDQPVAPAEEVKFIPTDTEVTELTLARQQAVIAKQTQLLVIAQIKEIQRTAADVDAAFNRAMADYDARAKSVIEAHGWKGVVMNPDTCEFFIPPPTPV